MYLPTISCSKILERLCKITILLAISAALFSSRDCFANEIYGIRLADRESTTRLVLDSIEAPKYQLNPGLSDIISFNINNTNWHGSTSNIHYKSSLIREIIAKNNSGNLVFTLKLSAKSQIKLNQIVPPSESSRFYRLVLDIIPLEEKIFKAGTASDIRIDIAAAPIIKDPGLPLSMQYEKSHSPATEPEKKSAAATPKEKAKPKKLTIIIDPGHGGVDPGALSASGLQEKNITLLYAKELRASLLKNKKYKVYLTRQRDVYVPLKERILKARDLKADLFISLHADTHPDPKIRGLSVYTLSPAASQKQMEKLAAAADKTKALSKIDLSHESEDTADVIIDLMQAENRNNSARFAETAVKELGSEARLLQHSHRFAGFVVLTGIEVPSVLIELGYLSNAYEEHMLSTAEYRKKLVKGITKAVDDYFVNKD